MRDQYDAIIIGAGIIGAATAFELAKLGYRTLNVDRFPAAGYGPTSSSCAIIRVHYSTFDGIALAWEGYHYWREWAKYLEADDERGLAKFVECGCLVMKTAHNGHLDKHVRLSRELGIPFEEWDAAKIRDRLPIYDTRRYGPPRLMHDEGFGEPSGGELSGGVFWPTAGYISDPQLSTHNLQRAAEAKGAEFRFGREVVGILMEKTEGGCRESGEDAENGGGGGRMHGGQGGRGGGAGRTRGEGGGGSGDGGRIRGVKLDDGTEVAAPIVVNIAGPHSAIVNRMAGTLDDMTIETKPLRQEVVHVPAPAGFDFESLGIVVSDSDIGCYVRPETGNHILIGSEDPECDPREFVDPDDYVRDFTEQGATQAHRYGQRVPSLGIPSGLRGVVDLYDASDDWIPIYDKSRVPGFYMAIGTSGNQFKNAPVAGRMMAALIDYCEQGNDHDARPLSFRLDHIGRQVDVGFYSRKREINRESSFSVLG